MSAGSKLVLAAIGLLAFIVGVILMAERSSAKVRAEIAANAYEEGLTDGIKLASGMKPTEKALEELDGFAGLTACIEKRDELESEVEACAGMMQTQAANRANARAFGWEAGYRAGREDWTALPYDCRRMR